MQPNVLMTIRELHLDGSDLQVETLLPDRDSQESNKGAIDSNQGEEQSAITHAAHAAGSRSWTITRTRTRVPRPPQRHYGCRAGLILRHSTQLIEHISPLNNSMVIPGSHLPKRQ